MYDKWQTKDEERWAQKNKIGKKNFRFHWVVHRHGTIKIQQKYLMNAN